VSILLRGSTEGSTISISTMTVVKPGGVAAGDLLLVVLNIESDETFFERPAGWAEALVCVSGTGNSTKTLWEYKIAGESEPAEWIWTLNSNKRKAWLCLAYHGHHETDYLHKLDGTRSTESPGVYRTPASPDNLLPTEDNCVILAAFGSAATGEVDDGWTTPPSGWTERAHLHFGAAAARRHLGVWEILQETAAAISATAEVAGDLGTNRASCGIVAIRPAASGLVAHATSKAYYRALMME
jgi:hypothetical protein